MYSLIAVNMFMRVSILSVESLSQHFLFAKPLHYIFYCCSNRDTFVVSLVTRITFTWSQCDAFF